MNSVFNSPPNWPPPPAGWTPPPGWVPDPSWPEPPPGWQFQVPASNPPPARNAGRLWLMIGLPLGGVALLIVGVIVAIVVVVANSASPAEEAASSAASSYAQAMQDQRFETAFMMRCAERRGDHDAFVGYWTSEASARRGITGFDVVGTKVETINGTTTGNVDLRVRYADGRNEAQRIGLTKTGGTWSPCN